LGMLSAGQLHPTLNNALIFLDCAGVPPASLQ